MSIPALMQAPRALLIAFARAALASDSESPATHPSKCDSPGPQAQVGLAKLPHLGELVRTEVVRIVGPGVRGIGEAGRA